MTKSHKTEPILVGRRDELERFGDVLASPKGQAVLVVGPQGMGKALLVNRMARMAQTHPDLKCGTVRYEVTKTDDVATTMALMIDHAFEAAKVGEKLLSGTGDQWRALFKAIGAVPVVGKAAETIGELALNLNRDPAKDTRTQFIERLRLISEKMPDNGRAIFVIDPEKPCSRVGRVPPAATSMLSWIGKCRYIGIPKTTDHQNSKGKKDRRVESALRKMRSLPSPPSDESPASDSKSQE